MVKYLVVAKFLMRTRDQTENEKRRVHHIGVTSPGKSRHTRRGSWLVGVLVDVVYRLADRGEFLGVFVADLEAKLLLQRHDQLDQIE